MSDESITTNIKIILIGDSKTGKTSILNQYINKQFSYNFLSTIGIGNSQKEIVFDNKKIVLDIWDTAGQERFSKLNKLFMKNSKIVILVYDITSKDSFEHLKNNWYEQVKTFIDISTIIVGIAANKHDLYMDEVITIDEATIFSESINAFLYETSATEFDSVNHLFYSLVEQYFNKFLKREQIQDNENSSFELSKEEEIKEESSCCIKKKKNKENKNKNINENENEIKKN